MKIDEQAEKYDYTSRSEFLRQLLREVVLRARISFEEEEVELSPAAVKRYNKMIEDIRGGKNVYRAESKEEFLKQLGE